MSVIKLKITDNDQDMVVDIKNKEIYGDVPTPYSLIEKIFNLFPESIFKNPNLVWLDPCVGRGYFAIYLFHKLFDNLKEVFQNSEERKQHIIKNMIKMCEVNSDYYNEIYKIFGSDCNLYCGDFFSYNETCDVVIGNPPFMINGFVKTPTNNVLNKRKDGQNAWFEFIKHSISLLRNNGFLSFIVPSIWMRPDRNKVYNYMFQYDIQKIRCLTNTETNNIFKGNAQTPTCFFLLSKREKNKQLEIFDPLVKKYIKYSHDFGQAIPVHSISVFLKMKKYVDKYGCVEIKKTNVPNRKITFSDTETELYKYKNISTCKLRNRGKNQQEAYIEYNYSDKPSDYAGITKLVLAHKMYGFPYYDKEGKLGISKRDSYIITDKNLIESEKLAKFLSTKFIRYVFEGSRYRMKYIDRYVFNSIPDITKIPNFPTDITDESLYKFFKLTKTEQNCIDNFYRKKYITFYD